MKQPHNQKLSVSSLAPTRKAMVTFSFVAVALAAAVATASPAFARELSLDQVMTLQQGRVQSESQSIGHVREVVLREIGQSLGARIGFAQRSREILSILDARQGELDRRFDFGRLVIGNNVLPPVISESRDVVSVQDNVLRVAGLVYQIDEPARFALPSPTWRNWLWMGLDTSGVTMPELSGSLPANDAERAFWRQVVAQGHELGRLQAQEVFDHNMALLERTYSGMRRFYDLYHRGVVTAPVLASAHRLTHQDDPNSLAVGDAIFRITAPTGFTAPNQWVPLDAPLNR